MIDNIIIQYYYCIFLLIKWGKMSLVLKTNSLINTPNIDLDYLRIKPNEKLNERVNRLVEFINSGEAAKKEGGEALVLKEIFRFMPPRTAFKNQKDNIAILHDCILRRPNEQPEDRFKRLTAFVHSGQAAKIDGGEELVLREILKLLPEPSNIKQKDELVPFLLPSFTQDDSAPPCYTYFQSPPKESPVIRAIVEKFSLDSASIGKLEFEDFEKPGRLQAFIFVHECIRHSKDQHALIDFYCCLSTTQLQALTTAPNTWTAKKTDIVLILKDLSAPMDFPDEFEYFADFRLVTARMISVSHKLLSNARTPTAAAIQDKISSFYPIAAQMASNLLSKAESWEVMRLNDGQSLDEGHSLVSQISNLFKKVKYWIPPSIFSAAFWDTRHIRVVFHALAKCYMDTHGLHHVLRPLTFVQDSPNGICGPELDEVRRGDINAGKMLFRSFLLNSEQDSNPRLSQAVAGFLFYMSQKGEIEYATKYFDGIINWQYAAVADGILSAQISSIDKFTVFYNFVTRIGKSKSETSDQDLLDFWQAAGNQWRDVFVQHVESIKEPSQLFAPWIISHFEQQDRSFRLARKQYIDFWSLRVVEAISIANVAQAFKFRLLGYLRTPIFWGCIGFGKPEPFHEKIRDIDQSLEIANKFLTKQTLSEIPNFLLCDLIQVIIEYASAVFSCPSKV